MDRRGQNTPALFTQTDPQKKHATAAEEAVMIASLPFEMTPFVPQTETARPLQFRALCVCSDDNTLHW